MRVHLPPAPQPTPSELAAKAELERPMRLAELAERLRHRRSRVREEAAKALAAEGAAALGLLTPALLDPEAKVREAAADSLGEIADPGAVPELCQALRHKSFQTRVSAARALGAIGDARALPELLKAQKAQFGGHSARFQLLTTPVLLAAAFTLPALVVPWLHNRGFGVTVLVYFCIVYPLHLLHTREAESELCGVVIEAIRAIAERNPQPGLHQLVPELRAISGNRLSHNKKTRDIAAAASNRLELLTEKLHQLPVAVASVPESGENRPIAVYPD